MHNYIAWWYYTLLRPAATAPNLGEDNCEMRFNTESKFG